MTRDEMLPRAFGMAQPTTLGAEARRALGRRVLALVIDLVVLWLIDLAVNAVFGVTHVTSGSPTPPPGAGFATFTSSTDVGWVWLGVIWLVYYTGLEALFGATVGKWAVHLRVTDREGRRAGPWAIVARNALRVVDGLPLGYLLGGSVALLSARGQRLGDHLAHTLVVPRAALATPLLTPAQLHRRQALTAGIVVACLAFSATFFYYGRPPLVVQGMANTRQMMFSEGVNSYTLSAPLWGSGTVSYQITYVTEHPVDTCHAQLTLAWTPPTGWEPRYAFTSCDHDRSARASSARLNWKRFSSSGRSMWNDLGPTASTLATMVVSS